MSSLIVQSSYGPKGNPPLPSTNLALAGGVATWTNLTSTSSSPSPRTFSTLTYDKTDGYFVLFGGLGVDGKVLGDTWNFKSGAWHLISLGVSPPARYGAAFAFDLKDGFGLLFGGSSSNSTFSPLGDTWEFAHGSWTRLNLIVAPSPRVFASLAYDPIGGYFVLFGGNSSTGVMSDTWLFQGNSWIESNSSVQPPPRYGAAITFDPGLKSVVLFGGKSTGGSVLSDTWYFGNSWTRGTTSQAPPARVFGALTYNKASGAAVLFGGTDANSCALQDTWLLGAGGWALQRTNSSPPPLAGASGAFDPIGGTTVLFGGESTTAVGSAGCSPNVLSSTTWELNYSQLSAVKFEAIGLQPGTNWSVTLNGNLTISSSAGIVYFLLPTGFYQYSVTVPEGYKCNDSSGTFTVTGADFDISIFYNTLSQGGGPQTNHSAGSGEPSGIGQPTNFQLLGLVLVGLVAVATALYLLKRRRRL